MPRALWRRTPAEELWCRRRTLGLTGPEAAGIIGVGRTALWQAEGGDHDPLAELLLARLRDVPVRTPALLALARRRQGWGIHGTARRCKISHVTLLKKEAEGSPDLVGFWEGRGFTFVRGGGMLRRS